MNYIQHLQQYAYLIRLNKPIPLLLLLWPTLWGLWLASGGVPEHSILFIFIGGVLCMRSAGCAINDVADRHIDGHVARTKHRPLATGQVSVVAALLIATVLALFALLLVWQCNKLTILLACLGAVFAVIYPFLKRVTFLPQLGLGVAFTWGIPMAFAAVNNTVPAVAWFLFATAVLWPVIYDTQYAMADREDDIKIGVKSTAILFGQEDKKIIGILQLVFLLLLSVVGYLFDLRYPFYLALVLVGVLFLYQQWLIKDRVASRCIQAFLNNHWVGLVIFVSIALSSLL